MKQFLCGMAMLGFVLVGCSKKKEADTVPPGFCGTQVECQPEANRQNAYQDRLRQKLVSQGVHDQYLPCGKYAASKAANGFWQVTQETNGCPPTASQQDPHPGKTKDLKQQ